MNSISARIIASSVRPKPMAALRFGQAPDNPYAAPQAKLTPPEEDALTWREMLPTWREMAFLAVGVTGFFLTAAGAFKTLDTAAPVLKPLIQQVADSTERLMPLPPEHSEPENSDDFESRHARARHSARIRDKVSLYSILLYFLGVGFLGGFGAIKGVQALEKRLGKPNDASPPDDAPETTP